MSFEALVDQAERMLERRGRLTYALLRRHFQLEDAALADLTTELVEGRRVALDEGGVVLVWRGDSDSEGRQIERRQLTVLFCDLVDSTRLSSIMDPEDYGELLHRYQEVSADVVRRFDCHIAQLLGDGILVYAGYPVAHEDSAERAVRIGLGILDQLPALNEEVAASGQRLAVRVGIHTGLVIVGDVDRGTRREELALGLAPNVAARIQSLAAPDTVFVSDATQRLLGNRFDCEDMGQHRLKGVRQLMTAYRIHKESTNATSHADRGGALPRLVGREDQLAQIRDALAAALGGHGRSIVVTGEAGIGKTRLVQTLCAEAAGSSFDLLLCRGSPHYQDTPLHAVISSIEGCLGWSDQHKSTDRLVSLEEAVAAYPVVGDAVIPLFAEALFVALPESRYSVSTLSPRRQRDQLFDALVTIVRAQARRRPLLVVVEDLHWLDPTSLALLERLVAEADSLPLLLLTTCRRDFTPSWQATAVASTVEVKRLDARQSEQLIEHIAGDDRLPATTVGQIVERADGVPLFIEEITRAVLESGPAVSAIPTTLHDSLIARLERLGSARNVVLDAAVIGREFELSLLQAVSPLDDRALARELARLTEHGLLIASESAKGETYSFRHVLVRDAAYRSILRRRRREIHARIAQCIEQNFAAIRDARPEFLARQFCDAGNGEKARLYWRRAGAIADARSAYVEATRHYARALDALATESEVDAAPPDQAQLLIELGRATAIVSGWGAEEVAEFFARALAISRRVGDQRCSFVALSGLRTQSLVCGQVRRGQELAEELLAVARDSGRETQIMVAHGLLGDSLYRLGDIDAAVAQLERGRALIPMWQAEAGYAGEDARVHLLSHLALALWTQGHTERALACSDESLRLARSLAHPLSLAYALRFAADLQQRCRAPDAVLEHTDELLALAKEQDFGHHIAIATILRGWARAAADGDVGDPVDETEIGIAEMRRGLAAYRATGAILNLPFFLAILAEACMQQDCLDEGLALTREALTLSNQTQECCWDAEILRTRGELLERCQRGQTDTRQAAMACYREALAVARKQGAGALESRLAAAHDV